MKKQLPAIVVGVAALIIVAIVLSRADKRPAPQVETRKQEVEGAFGFQFGKVLAENYEIKEDKDGAFSAWVNLPDDQKPFTDVSVGVTKSRVIFSISATATCEDESAAEKLFQACAKSMREKYGLRFHRDSERFETVLRHPEALTFGEAPRLVTLMPARSTVMVWYEDGSISGPLKKELDNQKQSTMESVAGKL